MYTTKAQICIRRDTAANFTSANPTLALGEIAYETDTRNIKVGDGATAWTALKYINPYRGDTGAASGTSNTALGNLAGNSLGPSSANNVALGNLALSSNSAGTGNTIVGRGAGAGNASFTGCTAVGLSALNVNTANDITAIGANALDANTTGVRNVAVGQDALGANTTGGDNAAVGTWSLNGNSTGSNNSALGVFSLGGNGSSNCAVGRSALSNNTTGSNNCAVGVQSMLQNGAGNNNCSVGNFTLNVNTGSSNTAIGHNALALSTVSDITAVGANALDANTTGTANTAVGKDALGANTTGSENVAIGLMALSGCTTQSGMTAVGRTAGASGTHNESTLIGQGAANSFGPSYSPLTSTSASVFVGWNARSSVAATSNEIAIGHGAIGNGSNTTTIGNSSTTGTFIPAGNLTLTNGNFIVGTSGKGIDFSATANSSGTMTSELLSDYEEGTFDPNIAFGGNNTNMAFTAKTGSYTKIGRTVFIKIRIEFSNKGTATGNCSVTALPFSTANDSITTPAAVWLTGTTFADVPYALVRNNASTFDLYEITNAGVVTNLTDADFTNTSTVRLALVYIT